MLEFAFSLLEATADRPHLAVLLGRVLFDPILAIRLGAALGGVLLRPTVCLIVVVSPVDFASANGAFSLFLLVRFCFPAFVRTGGFVRAFKMAVVFAFALTTSVSIASPSTTPSSSSLSAPWVGRSVRRCLEGGGGKRCPHLPSIIGPSGPLATP